MNRSGTTPLNGSLMHASPSTPIRAITSTLSARSAPPIPPASRTYEPLVKTLLRRRVFSELVVPSIVLSWLFTAVTSTSLQGGPRSIGLWAALYNFLSPWTLVLSSALWLLGSLPAIVLRHRYLAASPMTAPSPAKLFSNALAKRSTPHAFMAYIASSIFVTSLYILMARTFDSNTSSNFGLFVKSKKHPYYLNGRVLYLVSSQLTLTCAYLFRSILLDRFALKWPKTSSLAEPPVPIFLLARLATGLVTVIIFSALMIVGHTLLFGLARSVLLPVLYSLPFVSRVLRPFSAHFLRGSWSLVLLVRHWALVCRAFYLGLMTLASWEFAERSYGESVAVTHTVADPALTLVSGITSTDAYFKHLAYAELLQFAGENTPAAHSRRSALFADQKYSPSMWACLVRETLLTLGKDYQLLLRRGKEEPPAPAVPVQPRAAPSPPAPAMPLIRAPIYKASPSSPLRAALDTFASDGPLSAAVESTAEVGASHIPDLFRSVLHAPPAQAAVEVVKKSEEPVRRTIMRGRAVANVKNALHAYIPQTVLDAATQTQEWWTRERVHRVAEMCLPNRHLDALAAGVLCHLTAASLADDQYGVVQRDIPRILEALLSFLIAIEEYQLELIAAHPLAPLSEGEKVSVKEMAERERLALELAQASDVLSEVGDALKDGVGQIARAFGDKLAAFRFPPRIATKLQGFVDYL